MVRGNNYNYNFIINAKGNKTDWVHLNVGFGNSKSTYKENGQSTMAVGSNVTASKDVNITATGKDIDINGSNVEGENINLTAKGNVNITAKENSSTFNSKDTKSGSEVGVSFSVNGMSIYGNAYGMREKGEGTTITYTGSNVKAENELNITSGADTNIIGSTASGDKVNMDIGGDLNIESLQDTETQKWDTSSYSAGGSVGVTGGFNFNASTNTMDSDYKSVSEQAGIYAGSRGFDINVEGNTDLKAGVIDSTATRDKNTLNTGTITFSDIGNKAEYESKGGTVGFDSGKSADKDEKMSNRGVIVSPSMSSTGDVDSTTYSAVADGTITIRDKEKQKQDIKKLRRNTKNTLNNGTSRGFNFCWWRNCF